MSESGPLGWRSPHPPSPVASSRDSNSVAACGRTHSVVSECTNTEDEEGSDAIMCGGDDDDDDPSGRRLLRHQYRELISTVQQNREDMIRPSNNKLTEALKEGDKLFSNVRQTREAVLDAQFLVLATNLGLEKANQLHTDMIVFDPSVFAEQLLTFMGLNRLEAGESDEDEAAGWLPKDAWTKLGKETEKYFKRAPTFHYMLGSFKAEPPAPRQKIVRQKRVPNQEERRIMPTQLKKMDECHQEATEKEVERILGLLQQYFRAEPETPINFFDFVIDPQSFPRSVENIFHVSFIVRVSVK
uniref:Non-structural maintenance of chromosomes element 4 n=1 Tax=Callorhinchus milii TaxID=7868 RepID=A0A4W3HK01_CALMI